VRAEGRDLVQADDLLDVLDAAGETLTLGVVRGVDELELAVRFDTPDTGPDPEPEPEPDAT
jgi:hypothetical protein